MKKALSVEKKTKSVGYVRERPSRDRERQRQRETERETEGERKKGRAWTL